MENICLWRYSRNQGVWCINTKILRNSMSAILLQVVTCVVGLIIPRMILSFLGSEMNGMVQSITQFLSYIVLAEAGAGGVIRAVLYKPLLQNDYKSVSAILSASEKFFKKIAYLFIAYLIGLAIVYPFLIESKLAFVDTMLLVLVLGVSTLIQYYFSMTFQLFLQADQKIYILNIFRIVTMISNAMITALLLVSGTGILTVKSISALVLIMQPLGIYAYVRYKYPKINLKEKPDRQAIKQRWNAFGQHIAYVVYGNTDVAMLTCFLGLETVSVYVVYNLVITGLRTLIGSIATGYTPAIGHKIAQGNALELNRLVRQYEFICFITTNIILTVTAFMITPFVLVYTSGVTDVNYAKYVFGYLITVVAALYLIRNIYQNIIYSAGHYKQTQKAAYIETVLNIMLSLIFMIKFGMCGVMIGTILSSAYKILYNLWYLKSHILHRPIQYFTKCLIANLIALFINIAIYLCLGHPIAEDNFINWTLSAFIYFCIVFFITIAVNFIFFKDDMKTVMIILRKRIMKRKI